MYTDRDSGRWKVDPTETQRRRELFWELYTYDSWQACRNHHLLFGQLSHITSASASHLVGLHLSRWLISIASCPIPKIHQMTKAVGLLNPVVHMIAI